MTWWNFLNYKVIRVSSAPPESPFVFVCLILLCLLLLHVSLSALLHLISLHLLYTLIRAVTGLDGTQDASLPYPRSAWALVLCLSTRTFQWVGSQRPFFQKVPVKSFPAGSLFFFSGANQARTAWTWSPLANTNTAQENSFLLLNKMTDSSVLLFSPLCLNHVNV